MNIKGIVRTSLTAIAMLGALMPGNVLAASDASIELRMGFKTTSASFEGQTYQVFADLVNEKSAGGLLVNLFPADSLGSGTSQVENLVIGAQDIFAEEPADFYSFNKDLRVTGLPFLFNNYEHYQAFWRGEYGKKIHDSLVEQGLRVLNPNHNMRRGPYRTLITTRPVRSLKDVEGLKLRVYEQDVYIRSWKQLGASPTIITWGEVYLALQQGIVEAATSPLSLVYGSNFTEVAKYMTNIDEMPQDIIIVMNEAKYQSLPDNLKQVLLEAANEAGEWATKNIGETTDKALQKMKEENGLEVFDLEDRDLWAEKMQPVYRELEKEGLITAGIIDVIQSQK